MGKLFKGIKRLIGTVGEDKAVTGPRIELLTCGQVTVEGCKGFAEYGDGYIRLLLKRGGVAFTGSKMYAYSYSGDTVILKGSFSGIELFEAAGES